MRTSKLARTVVQENGGTVHRTDRGGERLVMCERAIAWECAPPRSVRPLGHLRKRLEGMDDVAPKGGRPRGHPGTGRAEAQAVPFVPRFHAAQLSQRRRGSLLHAFPQMCACLPRQGGTAGGTPACCGDESRVCHQRLLGVRVPVRIRVQHEPQRRGGSHPALPFGKGNGGTLSSTTDRRVVFRSSCRKGFLAERARLSHPGGFVKPGRSCMSDSSLK